MNREGKKAPGLADGGVIGVACVIWQPTNSRRLGEPATLQAISLTGDSFEVTKHQKTKIDPGRQAWPSHVFSINRSAGFITDPIEPVLPKNFGSSDYSRGGLERRKSHLR